MKKRLFSILMVVCMVLEMLPTMAIAEGSRGSAALKAGDATFTLSAENFSCAEKHEGEINDLQLKSVDVSQWKTNKKITVKYELEYRCSEPSCGLYKDGSFYAYNGTYTFTDPEGDFCHKKINQSFSAKIATQYGSGQSKDFTVDFTLTTDKGLSELILHRGSVSCTEYYYITNCWECIGCGSYFTRSDCDDAYKTDLSMLYFPPAGHQMAYFAAKASTCVDKGTVEYWQCKRCEKTFGDKAGQNELANVETDEPLKPHAYDENGSCAVCSGKAAAGVQKDEQAAAVWYDTMEQALPALTAGGILTVNADYDNSIALNKTCTVMVKENVTVKGIEIAETGDPDQALDPENPEAFVVTIINNGKVRALTGYTGKAALKNGTGLYESIENKSQNGTAGSFLHKDSEEKFCCYKTANGRWLHPDEAKQSKLENVTVAYAPLAAIAITGEGVVDDNGSYALTVAQGESVLLTAAAKDMDGNEQEKASYSWYDETDGETLLSNDKTLTPDTAKAGKRTILCKATADGYNVSQRLVLTINGNKDSQNATVKLIKETVGIREKVLPLLTCEGVMENAAVTYYQMLGQAPDPETDIVIDEAFVFTTPGEHKIYAYTAETDNYAATATLPLSVTVAEHANHCVCGGNLGHTHEETEWQAWDGKSAISYEARMLPTESGTGKRRWNVAYVYLTGDVSANVTVEKGHILHLCLNGHSFTSADPSQPAIRVKGENKSETAELSICDCADTGTLGGSTGGVSGGSVHAVWADVDLYSGRLSGNHTTGNGGAVYIESGTFTITGGAVSGNSAKNGGGIFAGEDGKVVLNGGAVSNNQAENGGGVYTGAGTWFKLNGGKIINNTAAGNGGGVYCRNMYNQNDGRCQFYGGSISGNSAKNGGGAYAANNTQVGYRNCKISGNTATQAGAGFYLDSDMLYLGSVYPDGGGYICPYIYDNTVAGAQNNLYLSRKDAQIQFTQRIETKSKMKVGVYFTGITEKGPSVLLDYLLVERDFVAETYRKPFVCDNPDYGRLESRMGKYYYGLYLVNTVPESTVTFDANGGTLTAGEETKTVKQGLSYGTLPVPKRTNYRFDGWFTEKDGGTKVEETTTVTSRENHTLYAHWTFIHEHCTCGGNIQTGDHTAHESAVYTAWNGTEAIRYTNNTAHVYLAQNATINSNLVVDGTTLYLCLSGNTLASNGTNKIQVKNGGRLVLCDCAGGGTIKGATKGWGGSCIYLYKSRLDMFGGTITGGKVTGNGGGGAIALDDSRCTFNLYGGEITNNNGKQYGGAIFLNSGDKKGGTVNMYGGRIANNKAAKGGVIFSTCGGTVNFIGGTISGNAATGSDGGVVNMAGGTITISGTVITGNTAKQYGGAIYLYDGVTVKMTGGEISRNKADKEGGAVHVYGKNSTFTLSGGKITGNTSVDGGAIYLNREPSVLNMTGGEISQNTATGHGGAVYIYRSGSVCNLSGGTIKQNTAAGRGGGIYINPGNNGQLNLSGAPVVQNNTVSGAENNVYLPNGKALSISGTMAKGAKVGITTENKNYPVPFANVYDVNYEGYFTSDDANAKAAYNSEDKKHYLTVQQYSVTMETVGNGTAAATPASAAAGSEITLTAAANADSHFTGWIADHPDVRIGGNKFTMPAANVRIKAIFEAHSFTAEVAEEQYLKAEATCTEKAEYYKSCAVCGLSAEGVAEDATFFSGNVLGHDWGAWAQNEGEETHTRVCNRDASHTETADCTGGTATCTEKAVCEVCGGAHGDLLAHDFSAEVAEEQYLKAEATCTEKAEYYKSCAVCGLSAKGAAEEATFFSGNVLGHDWGAWAQNEGEETHTRVCNRDASHTETADCTGGTATCTEKAVCEVCGGAHGEKDPAHHADGCVPEWTIDETQHEQKYALCGEIVTAQAAHAFGEWTVVREATATEDGCKERECEVCGYRETETMAAIGYRYYTIRAAAGAGGAISPCGEVSVREGESLRFTITPDKGYVVCDVKIDGKSIGAVKEYTFENVSQGHSIEVVFAADGSVRTGDNSSLPLWSAMLMIGAFGLAGVVLCKRKKRAE